MLRPAPKPRNEQGPGVPEAAPRTAQGVVRRLGVRTIDRLWIFPPLVQGRRESGLVAVSCFDGRERRSLWTAPYTAERTGKGLEIDWTLIEQGVAPPDRFPRVMNGVVQRAAHALGEPEEIEIAGSEAHWATFLEGFDADLLLPPEPQPEIQTEVTP